MFLGYQEKDGVKFISGVANTREELENNEFVKYSRIEETKDEYKLVNGTYMTVAEAFEKAKQYKREEINKARDEAEQGGFIYMGKVFDSDQVSCLRMTAAAQAMSLLPASDENKITWTTQDNSTIDLTAAELMGLVGALAQWSNTCHEKATALKAKIDACLTAEELDEIKWDDNEVVQSDNELLKI